MKKIRLSLRCAVLQPLMVVKTFGVKTIKSEKERKNQRLIKLAKLAEVEAQKLEFLKMKELSYQPSSRHTQSYCL